MKLYFLLIYLIVIICYHNFSKNINYINHTYNKKFIFNKFSYNYYNIFNKLMIFPRSSIKYLELIKILKPTKNDVILDIGSGDGLNLLYFNKKFNFKKIIGVEIDRNVYKLCKYNLNLIKSKKIELYNQDILNFNIPNDVTFFYLFNPFEQNYFFKSKNEYDKYFNLIKNIKKSYMISKRKIFIIFVNINDQKIFDIFSQNFIIFKTGYLSELFILKIKYTIFMLN